MVLGEEESACELESDSDETFFTVKDSVAEIPGLDFVDFSFDALGEGDSRVLFLVLGHRRSAILSFIRL